MNEILDLLEKRVIALVEEVRGLKRENARLRQELNDKIGPLAEENASLQKALAQEKSTRETAAKRIDALLQRVTERVPE
ncbi:hypothetical protein FACS1894168_1830 [Deltaproteobacteria bacterium]|nr:hypothetical protein FACS1894168_1830 [Deltaproteobacteria bacterium]